MLVFETSGRIQGSDGRSVFCLFLFLLGFSPLESRGVSNYPSLAL